MKGTYTRLTDEETHEMLRDFFTDLAVSAQQIRDNLQANQHRKGKRKLSRKQRSRLQTSVEP
jgi:hypothetical protein